MHISDTEFANLIRVTAEQRQLAPPSAEVLQDEASAMLSVIIHVRAAEALSTCGGAASDVPGLDDLSVAAGRCAPDALLACRTAISLRAALAAQFDDEVVDFATGDDLEVIVEVLGLCLQASLAQPGLARNGALAAPASVPEPADAFPREMAMVSGRLH